MSRSFSARRFSGLNLHQSPVEGAPALAVEIISPTNSALDMMRKVHQYLNAAECQVVWVLYPLLNFVAVHNAKGMREVKDLLEEEQLFAGR